MCVQLVIMLFRYCEMLMVMQYVFIMKLFMCVGMQWVIIVRFRFDISSLFSEYRLQLLIMIYDDIWLLIVQIVLMLYMKKLVVIVLKFQVNFIVIDGL